MSTTAEILERMNSLGALNEQELPAHGSAPKDVTAQGKYNGTEQDKRPLDNTSNKDPIDTSKGAKAPNATPGDDDKAAEDAIFKGDGVSPSTSTEGKTVKAKIKESVGSLALDLGAMRKLLEAQSEDAAFTAEALEIFESTLRHALQVQTEKMALAAEAAIAEAVETEVTIIESQVDDYLKLAIMEWAEDNKLAIETGIRANITESFMADLVGLFESYNVTLPDESVDLYEHSLKLGDEILEENEKLQAQLESVKQERDAVHKALTIEAYIEEHRLTRADADRVRSLAESIEYKGVSDFQRKLNILNEGYTTSGTALTEGHTRRKTFNSRKLNTINESVDGDGIVLEDTGRVTKHIDPTVSALADMFRSAGN